MVYVGANDGMLHAFIDSNTVDAGKETWAFVPSALFTGGDPNDTAPHAVAQFQLGALSYRRRNRVFSISSTSTPRHASGTSISRTPNPRHSPDNRATIGARYWWAGSAQAAAPCMRSTSPTRSR